MHSNIPLQQILESIWEHIKQYNFYISGQFWPECFCELGPIQEACSLCFPMEHHSRRKKTAAERRAQRLRSEGRRLQHAFGALHAVHTHRGGQLSPLGRALMQCLQQVADNHCPVSRGHNNNGVVNTTSGSCDNNGVVNTTSLSYNNGDVSAAPFPHVAPREPATDTGADDTSIVLTATPATEFSVKAAELANVETERQVDMIDGLTPILNLYSSWIAFTPPFPTRMALFRVIFMMQLLRSCMVCVLLYETPASLVLVSWPVANGFLEWVFRMRICLICWLQITWICST